MLGIDAGNGRLAVSLASGARVEADMVIVATGVRPNTAPLHGSGVEIASMIVVDERCETSVPGIYAAGDIAEGADGVTGARRVNATLLNAVEQGRVAGLSSVGRGDPALDVGRGAAQSSLAARPSGPISPRLRQVSERRRRRTQS